MRNTSIAASNRGRLVYSARDNIFFVIHNVIIYVQFFRIISLIFWCMKTSFYYMFRCSIMHSKYEFIVASVNVLIYCAVGLSLRYCNSFSISFKLGCRMFVVVHATVKCSCLMLILELICFILPLVLRESLFDISH